MFNIVLLEPEIPPNTGNIIRLCANTGCQLHLIEPLGFDLDDKQLRRAGLDYHEFVGVQTHPTFSAFMDIVRPAQLYAFSTRGSRRHTAARFNAGDALLFGPETRGLPQALLDGLKTEHCLRLPMAAGNRSLNLSNTVAIAVFEAWRQLDFAGGD